jgi:SAM-dependent methyltransferase
MVTREEAHEAQYAMYGDISTDEGFGVGPMQNELQRLRVRTVLREAPMGDGLVVDVGCGQAIVSKALSTRGNTVIAADLVQPRLSCSQDIRPGPHYVCVDGIHIPISSDSAVAVCAFEVIEHMPPEDSLPALQEWYRVLRHGGRLLLSTPNTLGLGNRLRRSAKPELRRTDHFNEMPLNELKRQIRSAGFHIDRCNGVSVIPGLWYAQNRIPYPFFYKLNTFIAQPFPQLSSEVLVVATK